MLRYPDEESRLAAIAGPYTYWVILFKKVKYLQKSLKYRLSRCVVLHRRGGFCGNCIYFDFYDGGSQPMPKLF